MSKLIRELRWGRPKAFKTGGLLTYPKPLLYLGFDTGGLDVLPSKNSPKTSDMIPFDCTYEDVVFCEPGDLKSWVTKPKEQQPKILAIDYTKLRPMTIDLNYLPTRSQDALIAFQSNDMNKLGDLNVIGIHAQKNKTLPWATIGWDGVSGYRTSVLSHFSSIAPNRMADARDWAYQSGQMCKRVMEVLVLYPCHIVVLMHDEMEKNDLSQQIDIIPAVDGKDLKNIAGGLFSQYFYAKKNLQGKPVILSNDAMFLKGLGGRWPVLTGETQPDFKSIYGKELI